MQYECARQFLVAQYRGAASGGKPSRYSPFKPMSYQEVLNSCARIIKRHDKTPTSLRERSPQSVGRLTRADNKPGPARFYQRQSDFLERVASREIKGSDRDLDERADDAIAPFRKLARQTNG